jgi:hypothetical protein
LQPRRDKESAKAAADDQRFELLVERGPREARRDVVVRLEALKRAGDLLVLVIPVRAQPLTTLRGVFLAQYCGSKPSSSGVGIPFGFGCVTASLIASVLHHD